MNKIDKKFIYGTGSAAVIAGVAAVIILLNLIAGILSDKFGWKIDVTETKLLDFSDEFTDVIKSVDKPVEAYYFADPDEIESIVEPGNYMMMAKQILEKMQSLNPKISVTVLNPDKNPELVNKLGTVNDYDIVFYCGGKISSMPSSEICSYDDSGNQALIAENKFSSMLASVTREETINVGFVKGHGELDVSPVKSVFDDEGISYNDFDIMIDGISDDYDLIFIYGPQTDYSVDEINAIEEYLSSGHNMEIYLDKVSDCERLAEYMTSLGLKYNPGYVEEKDPSHLMSDFAVPDVFQHTVTNTIDGRLVIPYTVSVTPLWTSKNSIDTCALLKTSDKATLYADKSAVGSYCLMAISSRVTESSVISNVIAGCSSYIYNEGVIDRNKSLLLNSVLWLGKADSDIYIAPKAVNNLPLDITDNSRSIWQAVYALVVPLVIIAAGFLVWFKRRYL